jgi:SAM-dependent methyltransferase
VVTAFNAIQYAADPVTAVKNMSQLVRPGGSVSLLVWGPPDQCESGVMFAELGPLLPPRPGEAPGAIAWNEDGPLEHLATLAGLAPVAVTDVPNPLIYPDLATAVRTQLSSGPARAAIRQ